MKLLNKMFGNLKINYLITVLAGVLIGVYTGIIMSVEKLKHTSFQDIGTGFEWWIFFALIIICNSKNPLQSALKTFIFFLISQPLIYLVQPAGLNLFLMYYRNWVIPTIATLPMAFIGWYVKKENILSSIILSPMLILLGIHISFYFDERHYLSVATCGIFIIILIFGILKKPLHKIISVACTALGLIIYSLIF